MPPRSWYGDKNPETGRISILFPYVMNVKDWVGDRNNT